MAVVAAPVARGKADRAGPHAVTTGRAPAAVPRPALPARGLRRPSALPVLRRCACGGVGGATGECPACRANRLAAESGAGAAPTPQAPQAPPIVYDVLRQPGAPLAPDVRAFMESRLGASLAATRIHTDGRAQRSAAAVDAHAYTVGRDIVFGSPGFDAGDRRSLATLAHELAHTVQDGGARWAGGPLELDSPHTESERAARAVGTSISAELNGAPAARVRPSAAAATGLARQVRREVAPAAEASAPEAGAAQATEATATSASGAASTITGSLTLVSPGAPAPTGERLCFPPGPIMGPQWGSGFGTIAERFIEADYCATLGCTAATEYIDNFNPTAYLTFMRAHNPSLTSGAPAVALAAASITGIARPDLMTDNAVRKEYYEIKPFSPDGVTAGMEKLVEIMAFMALLSLPYVPGIVYSPSKDIPMLSGMVLGEPLTVSLNVQRHLPGLVTYSLCLQGNLSAILAKVALTVLLAWIIAQLLMMAAPAVAALVLA